MYTYKLFLLPFTYRENSKIKVTVKLTRSTVSVSPKHANNLIIISGLLPPIEDIQFEIQRERNHSLLKLSWNVPLMNGNIIDYYIFVVNQRNRNLTSPAVNVTLPHNGSTVVIALNAVNCLGNGPVTTMNMKIGIT